MCARHHWTGCYIGGHAGAGWGRKDVTDPTGENFFMGNHGAGQPVDFIATDILRVRNVRITDNWHLEDNLTFLRQIGIVAQ